MASKLLNLEQASKLLNMTEDEVLYLVRTKVIPHRVESNGLLSFPDKEILSRIMPAPPKEAMPRQQIDIDSMTKDEILDLFTAVMKQKEEKEQKEAIPEEKPAEEKEEKEEAPATPPKKEKKSKTKSKTTKPKSTSKKSAKSKK